VWYFLIACVAVGTALMGPKIYKEITQHESTGSAGTSKPAPTAGTYQGVNTKDAP
jgi:hypothetical protein